MAEDIMQNHSAMMLRIGMQTIRMNDMSADTSISPGKRQERPNVVHPAAEAGVVGDIEICADQRRYQVYVLVVSPFLLHRIAHAVDECRSDDADKCGIPEFGAARPSAIAAVAFLDIQYIEQSLKKCHAGSCFHNLTGCFIDAMFARSLAGYTFRKLLLCKFR